MRHQLIEKLEKHSQFSLTHEAKTSLNTVKGAIIE